MPTEFRFDDLDLREEPRSTERTENAVYNTGAQPAQTDGDLQTTNHACTRICCV